MNAVATITPHLTSVRAPAAIRDLPGWLIWRFEHEPGLAKPRKVPFYASGGKRHGVQGRPEELQLLTTFDAASAAAARRGFDGVGFATLPDWGICALDFDNCITNGKIHPEVEALLEDTYGEYSPSGRGIRMFFRGNLGNDKDIRGDSFGMEIFSTKGFVTFTGHVLELTELMGNQDTVAPINDAVRALHRARFTRSYDKPEYVPSEVEAVGMSEIEIEALLAKLPTDLHYDDWVNVGMAVHHETQGEGFELWDSWSMRSGKYGTREYNEERWRSFGKRSDRPVTMRTVMKLAGVTTNSPASAEEFELLVDDGVQNLDATEAKPLRFQFEPVHEFSSTQALPWIIKGVLPKAGLGVVYGASGSGKSFAVLDMGMAIARGVDWRGKRTRQGRVAYIAAEGADGFRKRLAAYAMHHKVDLTEVPMTVLNGAPNLLEKLDAVDVAKGIKAAGGADLIVIDTFAQTTPGANENAGEDVGKALGYCKLIHRVTGAMVLLIHHSGKDATKGARGWSGLRAACDAEIEVVREAAGRYLRLTKSKDGEDGLEWGFDLEVIQVDVDEDLDAVTSCVVIEAAMPAVGGVSERKLNKNQQIVNSVIQSMLEVQSEGIEVSSVLDEAVRRMMARDGLEKDAKGNCRGSMRKALNSLCEENEKQMYALDAETNCVGAL